MLSDWDEIEMVATRLIHKAAALIKASFNRSIAINTKSDANDLVTEIDHEIEEFFVREITDYFPEHRIIAEEGTGKQIITLDGIVWIIDPIDGTTNFIHQQRNFAISVGIYENGVGMLGLILDVVGNELFVARRGRGAQVNGIYLPKLEVVTLNTAVLGINTRAVIANPGLQDVVRQARALRSLGSAALEIAAVASGRIDGYIHMSLSQWDYAAGAILIEEVGSEITDMSGGRLDFMNRSSVLVASPGLNTELLEKIAWR